MRKAPSQRRRGWSEGTDSWLGGHSGSMEAFQVPNEPLVSNDHNSMREYNYQHRVGNLTVSRARILVVTRGKMNQ